MCWIKTTKTSTGLKINENGVPGLPGVEKYERALAIFTEECAKHFSEVEVQKAISSITIEWWDKVAPSPSTGLLNTVVVFEKAVYSGLTVGSTCKVAWRGKLFRSAFAHELLHIVGLNLLNDGDAAHTNSLLWTTESVINTLLEQEDL